MKNICIKSLTYHYDKRKTDGIADLNLEILKGKVTAIIGPSGSGKTTTLKCLSGALKFTSGEIAYPENENIVYLDQQIYIDDNQLTVYELLENELILKITDEEKRSNVIRTALSELEITNEIQSYFNQLSGGQKQRVLIAKALIHNPTLLLFDEPFANLDRHLREQLLNELFELLKDKKTTLLWVTHSIEEAFSYSDQVVVLNYGAVQQIGSPREIYYTPQNLFVAQFISNGNTLIEKIQDADELSFSISLFGIPKRITKTKTSLDLHSGDYALVFIPSEAVKLVATNGEFKGMVEQSKFQGPFSLYSLKIEDKILQSTSSSAYEVLKFDQIHFTIDQERIYCIGKA